MKYKCLVVDDEELGRELIETHISALDQFELVASCESAIKARGILSTTHVDLVFLDIEMPLLKGTDFVRSMPDLPPVIFTTAYRDFALNAFDLDAVDYLLKPITFDRFFKSTQKFIRLVSNENTEQVQDVAEVKKQHIFIRHDRKQVKLSLSEIIYIESMKDYISIYLDKKKYVIKHSLSAFAEKLDGRFVRVHRSFIVNMDKVTAYTKHDVELGEKEIVLGDMYRSQFVNRFEST